MLELDGSILRNKQYQSYYSWQVSVARTAFCSELNSMGKLAGQHSTYQWAVQFGGVDGGNVRRSWSNKDIDIVLSLLTMDFSSFLVISFGGERRKKTLQPCRHITTSFSFFNLIVGTLYSV